MRTPTLTTLAPTAADRAGGLGPTRVSDVRRRNRRLVMECLRSAGRQSRAELTASTSLTHQALADILGELMDDDLVLELRIKEPGSGRGRPPAFYEFNPETGLALGAYVGRRNLVVVLADALGREVDRREVQTPLESPDAALALLADLARALLADRAAVPTHLTVTLHGDIDPSSGVCLESPSLGWHDVAVTERLGATLGIPVIAVHAAHAVALAEQREGLAAGHHDVVVLHVGMTPAAGILLGGRLYRGHNGRAGIIRDCPVPMELPPHERTLDEVASGTALVRNFAESKADPQSATWAIDIARSAAAGDEDARRVLAEATGGVVAAARWLVACFGPEMLILTGGLVDQAESSVAPLVRQIRASLDDRARHELEVAVSPLGSQSSVRGAVHFSLDELHEVIR